MRTNYSHPRQPNAAGAFTQPLDQLRLQRGPAFRPPLRTWSTEASIASRLDREADVELQQGRHLRAEYLAQRAFALREEGR